MVYDEPIETAFMMDVNGTDEDLKTTLIGRKIHGAILCPQPDGGEEWAVTIIPLGVVQSYERMQGMLKVKVMLLHGEVDKI